jgi:hypothetical protein
MDEILAFLLLCWMVFICGGSAIIMTYGIWQMLKMIYKGDFP